jgi:hypothetical protein
MPPHITWKWSYPDIGKIFTEFTQIRPTIANISAIMIKIGKKKSRFTGVGKSLGVLQLSEDIG